MILALRHPDERLSVVYSCAQLREMRAKKGHNLLTPDVVDR
jgi:hypothetical protein